MNGGTIKIEYQMNLSPASLYQKLPQSAGRVAGRNLATTEREQYVGGRKDGPYPVAADALDDGLSADGPISI